MGRSKERHTALHLWTGIALQTEGILWIKRPGFMR